EAHDLANHRDIGVDLDWTVHARRQDEDFLAGALRLVLVHRERQRRQRLLDRGGHRDPFPDVRFRVRGQRACGERHKRLGRCAGGRRLLRLLLLLLLLLLLGRLLLLWLRWLLLLLRLRLLLLLLLLLLRAHRCQRSDNQTRCGDCDDAVHEKTPVTNTTDFARFLYGSYKSTIRNSQSGIVLSSISSSAFWPCRRFSA